MSYTTTCLLFESGFSLDYSVIITGVLALIGSYITMRLQSRQSAIESKIKEKTVETSAEIDKAKAVFEAQQALSKALSERLSRLEERLDRTEAQNLACEIKYMKVATILEVKFGYKIDEASGEDAV